MIKYSLSSILNKDERHGPADGVIPVLTPLKPFIDSNLLVFSHIISFV
jgi:hypothetical protein